MAIKEAFEGQDDYTWDDFGLVDRSWDDWFADKWEPGGVFQIKSDQTTFGKFGIHSSITGSFTADFRPGFIFQSGTVSIPLAFSISTSGAGGVTRASVSNLTGVFTQTSNANVDFTGNIDITDAFTPIFTAVVNVKSAQLIIDLVTSLTVTTSRHRELTPEEFASVLLFKEIPIADPFNAIKALKETRILKAVAETRLATPFTENRLLDAFIESRIRQVGSETRSLSIGPETRTHDVISESRTLKVPVETRIHNIKSTKRLNNIIQETKVLTVDSENRIITIKRQPFTDSESIIKVRGE